MKKILLLLATVLTGVGAWAAVTQPETGVYTIEGGVPAEHRGFLAAGVGYADYPVISNIGWSSYVDNDATPIESGEHWYVKSDGNGKYYIYNLGLKKFIVAGTGTNINFSEYPYAWQIVVNSSDDNYNSIRDAGLTTYLCFACGAKPNNRHVKFNNSATDGGSMHTFTAVTDGETTYADQIAIVDGLVAVKEISYTLTDEAGSEYSGTYQGVHGMTLPTVTGVVGYTLTNTAWSNNDANYNYTATITFPFPVSSSENVNKVMISSWSSETRKWYADGDKIKTVTDSNATRGNINEHMWAIYPQFADGKFTFKIKNYSKNTFIKHNGRTDDHTQNALSLVSLADGEESVFTWEANNRFKVVGTDQFLSTESSTTTNQYLGSHKSTGHNGSKLKIFAPYYFADLVLADECGTVYEMTGYRFADAQEEPTITGFVGGSFNDIQWKENKFTADIKFPFPVSSNEQLNATQIANFNATQKWNAVGSDVKVQKIGTPTSSEIATSLWGIYPIFENGAFTYKIKNVATQSWVTVTKTENSFDTQGTVTLTDEGTILELINWLGSPCFKLVGQTVYLTINGSNDSNVYLATWTGGNDGHGGNKLHFPNATYTVAVGSTGFASLYTPVAGSFAGNIKTYAIESVSNSSAGLTEKTGIAANQGAIIEAAQGTYTFTAGEVSSDWSSNLLKGTSVNTYVEGDAYVLSNKNGIGLYKADLNKNAAGETGTTHFLNNAGKAYLTASAVTGNARFLSFDFDGNETAIESIESVENNAVVYDLAGRRVQGVQKGIYVVNGKVVIK